MTQKIANWLGEFEDMGVPTVDALWGEGWAIFPRGLRQTVRADILGGQQVRVRAEFALKLHRKKDPRGGDPGVEAMWHRLALWVRSGAPRFGQNQTVRLENARLSAQNKEDLARYEATLIVEYTQ